LILRFSSVLLASSAGKRELLHEIEYFIAIFGTALNFKVLEEMTSSG
jgi:hypothetical protein